jgi:glycosyltransferase involved in cell wall biosynthesis
VSDEQSTKTIASPAIAIVCNSLPPYRTHVHQRIAREIPEVTLWTILTHQETGEKWTFNAPEEIRPVSFSEGYGAMVQGQAKHALAEWRKGGRIIQWMKAHDVRAVVMLGYNDPGRLRVIRWAKKNRLPLFLWGDSNIRGDRVKGWRAVTKRIVVRRVIRTCTGLLPCGEWGKQFFAKYGGDEHRMFYFPVEPDYELIEKLPAEKIAQVQAQYKLDRHRRRLIFSARMIQVKRPDLCVDAFTAIAAQRPDWDLLMVGEGVLRNSLMERVPPELRGRILWTGFVSEQATVSALYKLSDVLVLPSDYEPWALVVNEAAAAGLAIVSSDVVGAANELVRDRVNGRMFAAGDLAALTEALLDVTDPAHIDAMKAASAPILAEWRRRGDPIEGLRSALRFSKVIP